MKEFEIELQNLYNQIKSLPENDEKRLELIEMYNFELEDCLTLLKKTLPAEWELEDSLILEEYKEYKEYYKKNGYFNYERFVRLVVIIAEVNITKVEPIRGTVSAKVYADVIKLYKGAAGASVIFNGDLSYKPSDWFKAETVCFL